MERGVASRGGGSQPLAVGARHRPSGHYATGVRGVDRSGRKSGEGKAPARPKIATVEREEGSVAERRGRLTRALGAPQGALRGCRSTRTLSRRSATPHFGCAKPKAKPGRKKRAAGTRRYVCEWKCIQVKSDHHAQQTQSLPSLVGRVGAKRRGGGRSWRTRFGPATATPTPNPSPQAGGGSPERVAGQRDNTRNTRSSGAGQPSLTSQSPIHRFRALSPRAETKTSRPAREAGGHRPTARCALGWHRCFEPHPEERPKGASRRMRRRVALVLRDACCAHS